MGSYKSQILDGVLVQKQNRTSRCLKLHSVSIILVLNVHIPAYLGSGGSRFFGTCFFTVSADRRLVQIPSTNLYYELVQVNTFKFSGQLIYG
jgi:hypothetical protein